MTTTRAARMGLLLAVVLLASACASTSALRRVALASEQLAASTERLQLSVMDLHTRQLMTDDEYRAWQRAFGRLATVGLALNEAIRQSDGQAAAGQVRAGVDLLDELLRQEVIRVPLEHRLAVVLALESVRAVLVSLSVAVED